MHITITVNGIALSGELNPIVAKVGGLRPKCGGKGEAVVIYCEPLPTLDLESSGFPRG